MAKKILLVDDSITIRRVFKNILTRMFDNQVVMIEAGNGLEALNMLKIHTDVSLVFLDVNMPVMGGEEFLKRFRADKENKHITVVICTTEGRKETVLKLIKLGANGYIVKPFTPDTLRKSITPIAARLGLKF